MIIGLTGGYCVGKSSAAAMLGQAGWRIVDVDSLGHRALEMTASDVAALLGPSALRADGRPDRRAIGAIVFENPSLLASFEAIVHPVMNALVDSAVNEAARGSGRVCVDAALLYRLPILERCDAVIEMRAPLPARLSRARSRDGIGTMAALRRIASQRELWWRGSRWPGNKLVVVNDGDRKKLERTVLKAISTLG
ncbi:MAG: dephospho-CoA kinase [Spirochaetales bacterium]|nr:dephospho-CoA kinase [Spirochaetales bacterium]